MEWWTILIIVISAPLLLLPAAFIWYLNIAGLYRMFKMRRVAS